MARNEDVQVVLTGSSGQVRNWFTANGLVVSGAATAFAAQPSFQSANGLVASVDPLLHRLVVLAVRIADDKVEDSVGAVLHAEVATVIGSPWFGATGSYTTDLALGLCARFRVWINDLTAANVVSDLEVLPLSPPENPEWQALPAEAVLYVVAATLDRSSSEHIHESNQFKLERIQSLLGLRPGELTQLLDVSREGMRKWQAGRPASPERSSKIEDLYNLAVWFGSRIRPGALPGFMRRSVPALDGQTPMDWLRSRRWQELRRVYERLFSLETTR